MLYALSWFVVLAMLALWSLGAWAFHALGAWAVSSAGVLTGAASGGDGFRLPDWLSPWVPQEAVEAMTAFLAGLAPVVEGLLQAAPVLAGALSVVTWAIWGLGSVLLVLLGVGLHLLIALWRRRGGGSGPRPGQPLAA